MPAVVVVVEGALRGGKGGRRHLGGGFWWWRLYPHRFQLLLWRITAAVATNATPFSTSVAVWPKSREERGGGDFSVSNSGEKRGGGARNTEQTIQSSIATVRGAKTCFFFSS